MTSKAAVEDFISQRTLAIVGVSRSGQKFGNMAYRELKAKGCQRYPIHPTVGRGRRAWDTFMTLAETARKLGIPLA